MQCRHADRSAAPRGQTEQVAQDHQGAGAAAPPNESQARQDLLDRWFSLIGLQLCVARPVAVDEGTCGGR